MRRRPGGPSRPASAGRLIAAVAIAAAILVVPTSVGTAIAGTGSCYVIATAGGSGGGGLLSTLDPATGDNAPVGSGTGATAHHAVAVDPGDGTVYTTTATQFGRIDAVDGSFSPIGSGMGSANGPDGPLNIDDVRGLAFDPATGYLYATQNRPASNLDVLVRMDPATGSVVAGTFGGDDYLVVQSPPAHPVSTMVADIAFEPGGTRLFVAARDDGGNNRYLVTVDPVTGVATDVGALPVAIEGLSFTAAGQLIGTTGDTATAYDIDTSTAALSNPRALTVGTGHEGIDCISGTNNPPVFAMDLADRSDPAGSVVSLLAAATDPEGLTVEYAATGLPRGLSIDPVSGEISGRIGFLAAGAYSVEITATDGGTPVRSATDTFTWTVTAADRLIAVAGDGGTGGGGSDLLTIIDPADPDPATNETTIGTGTGTRHIEAAAIGAGTTTIYAVDLDTFGTIDPATGLFQSSGAALGAAAGPAGTTALDQITGMDAAGASGALLAVHKRAGGGNGDLLFAIDPATGTPVRDYFGAGLDYLVIDPVGGFQDVEALAVRPSDEMPFVVITDGSSHQLATLALGPGPSMVPAVLGTLGDAIHGLTFDGYGRLWGTSVGGSPEALYEIDPGTAAFLGAARPLDDGASYGAVTAPRSTANGAPAFDAPPADRTDAAGYTVTVAATAADPDGDTVTYTTDGLPPGVTIDGAGVISGTLGILAAAGSPYSVTVTATDAGTPALSATHTFTWTVTAQERLLSVAGDGGSVGGGGDLLVAIDPNDLDPATNETPIGSGTGTGNIWAATVYPGTDTVYAASDVQLGTIDPVGGTFTGSGTALGDVYGALGKVNVDRITGLDVDHATGYLLAAQHTNGSLVGDVLFAIDPATGAVVADRYGAGIDYLVMETVDGLADAPALAVRPSDGSLFAVVTDGSRYALATIEQVAGPALTTTIVGSLGDTIHGLTFDAAGRLWGTTVGAPPYYLYEIDPASAAFVGVPRILDDGRDYASLTAPMPSLTANAGPSFDPTPGDRTDPEGAAVSFTVTATDPEGDTVRFSAAGLPDGVGIDAASGAITGTIGPVAATGSPYAVTVTATDDGLPNRSTTAGFTWTVTATNQAPVVTSPGDRAWGEGDPVSVVVSATDPDGDGLLFAATGLPPGVSIDTAGTISGTIGPTATTASPYAVTVTVSDTGSPVQQTDVAFTWTVTATNQSPRFDALVADRTDAEGDTIAFGTPASDPDGNGLLWSAGGLPDGISIDPGSGVVGGTLTYLAAGIHTVTITVTDDGTPSLVDEQTFTWSVANVNRPPSVASIPYRIDPEGVPVSFGVTASDPDGDGLRYTATGLPPGVGIDPVTGVIAGTPTYAAAGTYPVQVVVFDDLAAPLSGAASFDWTITDVNRAPMVTTPADQVSGEGDAASVSIVASDPDGDGLGFAAAGLPPGLSIDTFGVMSGTVDALAASGSPYAVSITVTDTGSPAGKTVVSFAWTVTDTNRSPALDTAFADRTDDEGSAISLSVHATDPDGDGLEFGASGLPPGLTIDPSTGALGGSISFDAAGVYAVKVYVEDHGSPRLADMRTFRWTVTDVNRNPILTPVADRTDREGDTVLLAIDADDLDGDALTFGATGLPAGLVMDPASGVVAGTIGFAAAGLHTVSVTVTDDGAPARKVSTAFSWTVEDVNRPPSLDPAATGTVAEGEFLALLLAASDPDGDPLAFSVADGPDAVPAGVSVSAAGAVMWEPGEADGPGTVEFTVTATDPGGLVAATLVTITVLEVNLSPVLAPTGTVTWAEGEVVEYVVAASDPDLPAQTLTFAAEGLPRGLSIDPATGAIRGSPRSGTSGVYAVGLLVGDGEAEPVSAILTIRITDPAPPADTDEVVPPPEPPVDDDPAFVETAPEPDPVSPPTGPDLSGAPVAYLDKTGLVLTASPSAAAYGPPGPSAAGFSLSPQEGMMVAFRSAVETLRDQMLQSILLGVLIAWLLVLGIGRKDGEEDEGDPAPAL